MAQKSRMKKENLSRIQQFFNDIRVYPIDDEAADIYGKLKASISDQFGPREKSKRRKADTVKVGFSENDLWITAIAKRFGLIIV